MNARDVAGSTDDLEPRTQIRRACDLLKAHHLDASGILVARVDSKRGGVVDPSPIIEDLGDVVPFLVAAGEMECARAQVSDTVERIELGLLHANPRRTRLAWALRGYEWTDLLWGLLDWSVSSGDTRSLNATHTLITRWKRLFLLPGGRAAGYSLGRASLPLPVATLLDVGMFPEMLVEWAEIRHDPGSLDLARSIAQSWLGDDLFRRTGLFPKMSLEAALGPSVGRFVRLLLRPRVRQISEVRLFKDNTNLIASLLAVYRATGERAFLDAIDHWARGVRELLLLPDGGVAAEWAEGRGIVRGPNSGNFQVIDLMVDAAVDLQRDDFLDLARVVADRWLALQGSTGLFPTTPDSRADLSDHQTDLSVALLKLAEVTSEQRYLDAARRCLGGIARYHYRECGFADAVDIETGSVVDWDSKTKFLALSIKGWVAYERFGTLLSDRSLRRLLADR